MTFTDTADDLPELDPAVEAESARAAAAQRVAGRALRRPEAVPELPEPQPVDDNPFSAYRSDPDAGEAGLKERMRLNFMDSYYRMTLAGSSRLRILSTLASEEEKPDETPEQKERRDYAKREYQSVVGDLARFDASREWGTTMEAAVALTGQFGGGMLSPESWITTPLRGATMLGRALWAGAGQAAIQVASDPLVQAMSIASGVQKEYEPIRTAAAAGFGMVLGGGIHIGGELVSTALAKRKLADLAKDDASFRSLFDDADELIPAEIKADPALGADLGINAGSLFDMLKTIRDGGDPSTILPGMKNATPEHLATLAELTKGRSDDDLMTLAANAYAEREKLARQEVAPERAPEQTTEQAPEVPPPEAGPEEPPARGAIATRPTAEIDGTTIDFPDADHAALFELGRRIRGGERIEAAEAERLFRAFKDWIITDAEMGDTFHNWRDLGAAARDYFDQLSEQAARGQPVSAHDVIDPDLVGQWYRARQYPPSAERAVAETRKAATTPDSVPAHADATAATPNDTAGVFMFDARQIATDAKRFQYKEGGDTEGVTTALKGVTKWDRAKANQVIVWQDEAGKLFVADGHQRVGLARRLIAAGNESKIDIPGLLYRASDGFTVEHVRAIAAGKNIAEGSGTPLDAAKILRSHPELLDGSLPLTRTVARQGADLARLGDEAFGMVVNEVVPQNYAALVGRYIPDDHARQVAAMKALARFGPDNETEAAVLVQRVAQAELAKAEAGRQGGLFGDDFGGADSTIAEEMKIVARVIQDLKKDKSLFSRVVANAERIEQTGSTIEREAASAIAQDAELFARSITSDAFSAGPVRTALTAAAKEVKDGTKTVTEAAEAVLQAAREHAQGDVPDRVRDRGGRAADRAEGNEILAIRTIDRLRNSGPSLIEQREVEGQTRIPGVETGTLKDRLQVEAERPLRGGDKEPGPLFGDEGKQKDLFGLTARRGGVGALAMERQRPDTGVPTAGGTAVATTAQATTPQSAVVRSLQQMAFDLADALGVPLRQGRVQLRNALGVYKGNAGVIRLKEVSDFAVVAHESGHAVEAIAGRDLTNLTKQFAGELRLVDYDADKQRVNEGFAEFMRHYLNNRNHAEQIAPNFFRAFRQFMEQNQPQMLSALDRAADAYQRYLSAPSVDAIGATIRSMKPDTGFAAVADRIREDGFVPTIKMAMRRWYDMMWNEKADVPRVVRELGRAIRERTGDLYDLKFSADPAVIVRGWERSGQTAVGHFENGVTPWRQITPEGPTLNGAVAKMVGEPPILGRWDKGKLHTAEIYMIAKMAIERWGQYERKEIPNPPTSFSKADAIVAVAELERLNPTLRQGAEEFYEFHRQLLRRAFEAGVSGLDRATFDRLMAQAVYVPMMRDLSDRPLAGGAEGREVSPGLSSYIKRFAGSSRDILSPIQTTMMKALLLERKIMHSEIMRSFENLSKAAGIKGGVFFERLPAHEAKKHTFDLQEAIERVGREKGVDPDDLRELAGLVTDMFGDDPITASFFRMEKARGRGEPIVFYNDEKGEQAVARVITKSEGYALYEALTALPNQTRDIALRVMALGSQFLVKGVTTHPMYLIYNWFRDQYVAWKLIPGYIPIYHGARGLYLELADTEMARLRATAGGVSGGTSMTTFQAAQRADVNALAKSGWAAKRFTSWSGFLDFLGTSEASTKTSVFEVIFKEAKRQGLNDYEAVAKAKFESDDLLDFGIHGSHMQAARAVTPFIQANLTGLDKARRTMITPIRRWLTGDMVFTRDNDELRNAWHAWVKTMAIPLPLGLTWAALNWDKRSYRDANPEIKSRHYMTEVGGTVILLPKDFELSVGFTLGEYLYAGLAQDDPRAMEYFAKATRAAFHVPMPFLDNPLIKTTIGNLTDENVYSWLPFQSRPITPRALEGRRPEHQYTERTTDWAKAIGTKIGMSPIKVEYTVGSLMGSWGRDIIAMSQAVDADTPEMNWSDYAVLKRGLKDPNSVTDVSTRFWDYLSQKTGKFSTARKTYDDLVNEFGDKTALEFLRKEPAPVRAWVTLWSALKPDGRPGEPAFNADEKRLHPIERARAATAVMNGVRKEIAGNTFKKIEDGTNVRFSNHEQGLLLDRMRELGQLEMVNALIIIKEPGYAGRPLHDTSVAMEKIKSASPLVAEELATRYATARIYQTQAVAKAYPELQRTLIRDGSEADLSALASDASADGYEFGGERVRRPLKRRIDIPAYVQ